MDDVRSIYSRNWPTLIGLFCILFIWAAICSSYFYGVEIAVDPGLPGLIGAIVGMAAAAVLFVFLGITDNRSLWQKLEVLIPAICATALAISRFYYTIFGNASLIVANLVLGFSTVSLVVLSVAGIRSEVASRTARCILSLAVFALYAAYFLLVFAFWPTMGDSLADKIGQTLHVVFLFSMIVMLFTKMQKFSTDEPQPEATPIIEEMESGVEDIHEIGDRYCLSPREQEVLLLLAQGYSAPHVADVLYISNGTVKTHVSRIYRKLGVGKRDELIALLRNGTGSR
jgi:DNA-binding CsgD family transcriptional regulator